MRTVGHEPHVFEEAESPTRDEVLCTVAPRSFLDELCKIPPSVHAAAPGSSMSWLSTAEGAQLLTSSWHLHPTSCSTAAGRLGALGQLLA
jgi:hypothetical protein